MILSGKPVAEKILAEAKTIAVSSGVVPGLGVVLVGDDPSSRIYVSIKESRAGELCFHFRKTELPVSATEAEILDAIRRLNEDAEIHGIIVQLPLPDSSMNVDRIIAAVDPLKDADGFLFASARTPVFPEAMIELAKSSGIAFSGKSGVVLANSERFGKTMANALWQEGMLVKYIFPDDIGTSRLMIGQSDFVFTALGKPGILLRNMFKKDAVVIDGGITRQYGKIVGDVSVEGGGDDVFLSPVPGGVGPVTVACLLRRVAILASEKEKTAT